MVFLSFTLCMTALGSNKALAIEDGDGPSVLIVDSNLGDLESCKLHWLGDSVEVLAEDNGRELSSANQPVWWSKAEAADKMPATFVFGHSDNGPTTAEDIVWALDRLQESKAQPKTFIVAFGETGLPVREYAEDMSSSQQSARADVVGIAFCGTSQSGLTAVSMFPRLNLWDSIAASVGKEVADLQGGSDYLESLNEKRLPVASKELVVFGDVGDLGFGTTDGANIQADLDLADTVAAQVDSAKARATISQKLNLSGAWLPLASTIDNPGMEVDKQLAERLSAIPSYETSDEVQQQVREFYNAWFSGGAPMTHGSYVMALDLSGSMLEKTDQNVRKLDAAQEAASEYLHAMSACAELPFAAPEDVTVFGFNVALDKIASSYDDGAIKAIDSMSAMGETNLGMALDAAYDTTQSSPRCANRRILILSDGASTEGKSDETMLAEAAAASRDLGVIIDVVGFGDVGESNAGFLKKLAETAGGAYYQASDTYDLKVDFLTSYYSSLGLGLISEEAGDSAVSNGVDVGTLSDSVAALQIGIVADGDLPKAKLFRNGEVVEDDLYEISVDGGLMSVRYMNPPTGSYSLTLEGTSKRSHVFAVAQLGMSSKVEVGGEQLDISLYLLIGAAVILVIGIIALLVRATSRRTRIGDRI